MPNRVRVPPARYLAIAYAPALPMTTLTPTVVTATIALRAAAERIPDVSTVCHASSVGVNEIRNGSFSCSGDLTLANAIQSTGNRTEIAAAHSSAMRQIATATEPFMTV